jgi:hypothetical protein
MKPSEWMKNCTMKILETRAGQYLFVTSHNMPENGFEEMDDADKEQQSETKQPSDEVILGIFCEIVDKIYLAILIIAYCAYFFY